MRHSFKRAMALVLALVMALSCMSLSVWAGPEEPTAKVYNGEALIETYNTLEDAIANAEEYQTIRLSAGEFYIVGTPAEGVEIIGEGKDQTTIYTSEAGNIIANKDVKIKNVSIDGKAAANVSYAGAINIKGDGAVIENCDISGGGQSTWGASVAISLKAGETAYIKNSELVGGFRAVFLGSTSGNVVIDGCTISPQGAYCINVDGGSDIKLNVSNSTFSGWTSYSTSVEEAIFTNVNFELGENNVYNFIKPYSNTSFIGCSFDETFQMGCGAAGITYVIQNCTKNGEKITKDNYFTCGIHEDAKKARTLILDDGIKYDPTVDAWVEPTAMIGADDINYYYSLADAVAAVPTNGAETTITMIEDETIAGNAGVTIAVGKNIVLDLNGHTIQNAVNENKASQVIENNGTLTIRDSATGGLITNAIEEGTEPGEWWSTPQYNYATNVIKNSGTLNMESGRLLQTAAGSICYAVDNNSTSYDTVLNVSGGVIEDAVGTAVRMFCNSTTKENTINMTGGTITTPGYAAIWTQLPGKEPSSMKKAKLDISGGTISAASYAWYDYSYGDGWDNVYYEITGGKLTGYLYSYGKTGFISGGFYTEEPWSGYIADGYEAVPLQPSSEEYLAGYRYEVKAAAYVARVGATSYKTLAEAYAAASAGDTVTLLQNVALGAPVDVDKKITLDLAGKTITNAATYGSDYLLGVKYNGDLTIEDSVGGGKITTETKSVYAAVKLTLTGETRTGSETANLTVNGGTLQGYYYGITGHGSRHGTVTTVNGGKIKGFAEEDNLGIYHPQDGTLTINGGTITGYSSAVELRAGTLNVSGGTLTATAPAFDCTANGSGTTTVGAALAIAQHTTKKDIAVNISGGTFNGKAALSVSNPQGNDQPIPTLAVTGGTFTGILQIDDTRVTSRFITGGTFSADPDARVSDAHVGDQVYRAAPVGGVYIVGLADVSTTDKTDDTTTITSQGVDNAGNEVEYKVDTITIDETKTVTAAAATTTTATTEKTETVITDHTMTTVGILVTEDVKDINNVPSNLNTVQKADNIYIQDTTGEEVTYTKQIPITSAENAQTETITTKQNTSVEKAAGTFDTHEIAKELAIEAVKKGESLGAATSIGYGMSVEEVVTQTPVEGAKTYEIHPVAIAYKDDAEISRAQIKVTETEGVLYDAPVPKMGSAPASGKVKIQHLNEDGSSVKETIIVSHDSAENGSYNVKTTSFSQFTVSAYNEAEDGPILFEVAYDNNPDHNLVYTEASDWSSAAAVALQYNGTITIHGETGDSFTLRLTNTSQTVTVIADGIYEDNELIDYYQMPVAESGKPGYEATVTYPEDDAITAITVNQGTLFEYTSHKKAVYTLTTEKAYTDSFSIYIPEANNYADDVTMGTASADSLSEQYYINSDAEVVKVPVMLKAETAGTYYGANFTFTYDTTVFSATNDSFKLAEGVNGYAAVSRTTSGTTGKLNVQYSSTAARNATDAGAVIGYVTLTRVEGYTSSADYTTAGKTDVGITAATVSPDSNQLVKLDCEAMTAYIPFAYTLTVVVDPDAASTPTATGTLDDLEVTETDGTWTAPVLSGSSVKVTTTPNKGYYPYSFKGNIANANSEDDWGSGTAFTMMPHDTTLNADFKPKTFTFTLVSNEGDSATLADMPNDPDGPFTGTFAEEYNFTDKGLDDPTRTGYTFTGWAFDADGHDMLATDSEGNYVYTMDDTEDTSGNYEVETYYDADLAQTLKNVTLYAIWENTVFVKAYPLTGNLILITAYSSANETLTYEGVQMYKDERFGTINVDASGNVAAEDPEYFGLHVFSILIDASRAQRSYSVSLAANNLTKDVFKTAAKAKIKVTAANMDAKTIADNNYNVNGVAGDGVSQSGATIDVGVADVTLAYRAYLADYSFSANSRTGIVSGHDTQYLLSDASLSVNNEADDLIVTQSALLTLEDVDYIYIASLGADPAAENALGTINRVSPAANSQQNP